MLCVGVLREGDELLEINGIALIGKTTDEIIRLMVSTSYHFITFSNTY